MIEVNNLIKKFGDFRALDGVNMHVASGNIYGLVGPNGAGKSTLIRHLTGVYRQDAGEIFIDGAPVYENKQVKAQMAYIPDEPFYFLQADTLEMMRYFRGMYESFDEKMFYRLQEFFPGIDMKRNIRRLSKGMQKQVAFWLALCCRPKLLILDEPTSQLDPIAASDFLETVRKINRDIGTTVILTEHRLQDVIPWADKVYVLDQGGLLTQGTPGEIGEFLKEKHHGMFLSMPVPMQIYAEVESDLPCPLTVRDGRNWITQVMQKAQSGRPEKSNTKLQKTSNGLRNKLPHRSETSVPPAIQVKDVWFRYEKEGRDVVQDLNLEVEQGEFYALVGGNGTGKSTTLSLISRVRAPYRGKILLNGIDIRRYTDIQLYRGYLGVLPQNPQSMFIRKTVREDLYSIIGGAKEKKSPEYTASMKKAEAIEGIVSLTRLEGLLDRHPYDLSGGEQQRLALAKVLLLQPRLLLMDEPTKGLDAEYKQELGEILKKLQEHGITIFMISHDVEFVAEYADRVGLFFQGNVVTSKPAAEFFAGNSFYTTAANRMARHYFPEAVTGKEVAACLKERL